VGSNSSRANSPFLSTKSALGWVRAGPGLVWPAHREGKHQEIFFTTDLALLQKMTEFSFKPSLRAQLNLHSLKQLNCSICP